MISALLQGTLVTDPVRRVTSSAADFWTATVRVAAGDDALFVGIATFEPVAGERLMKLAKGGTLAAAGTLEQNTWRDKAGEERRGWRLTASGILSLNQARKRREAVEHA